MLTFDITHFPEPIDTLILMLYEDSYVFKFVSVTSERQNDK